MILTSGESKISELPSHYAFMRFFISYRRSDVVTSDLAASLKQSLEGAGHVVFYDKQSIYAGFDFREKISKAIDKSDVVLVLIGSGWELSFSERTGEIDYVEYEISESLKKPNMPVIPVCISTSNFPKAQNLPTSIQIISKRDGIKFDVSKYQESLDNLITEIPVFSLLSDREFGVEKSGCNLNYFSAVAAPFKKRGWLPNLLWVYLMAEIPIFDIIALRGWRLDYVARVAQSARFPFPSPRDIPRHVVKGMLLWLMTAIYQIPLLLILLALDVTALTGFFYSIYEIFNSIREMQFDLMGAAIAALLSSIVDSILPFLFIFVLGFLLTGPIYRAGMIRYAITGKPSSFFHLRGNSRWVILYYRKFLILSVIEKINLLLVSIPVFLLTSPTGIGFGLAPLMHYSITANLYGQLGRAMLIDVRRGNSPLIAGVRSVRPRLD